MLVRIKSFVRQHIAIDEDRARGTSDPDPVPLAVCALLLEMAHADGEFSEEEMTHIIATMQDRFGLSASGVKRVMELADEERKKSIDLWQFTKLISKNSGRDEKLKILDTLWAIVYADGVLDAHEDYLIHKLAYVLDLSHRDLIDSKLRVCPD